MNCYFANINIDNGRASPHRHFIHLIIDEVYSEEDLENWAKNEAEILIDTYHPTYGAKYTVEINKPSEKQIKSLISKKENEIQELNSEISSLKALLI